jgi:hypothetical protein
MDSVFDHHPYLVSTALISRVAALPPRVLNQPRAVVLPLPPECGRYGLVSGAVRVRSNLSQLGRLLHRVALTREKVLGERVEYVHAVAEVAAADWNVHADDLVLVWLVNLERRLKDVEEVGQGAVSVG